MDTLFDRIKAQTIAVDVAERALNYAATPKHYDVALEIFNAECAKLNALWRLAKVEEVRV